MSSSSWLRSSTLPSLRRSRLGLFQTSSRRLHSNATKDIVIPPVDLKLPPLNDINFIPRRSHAIAIGTARHWSSHAAHNPSHHSMLPSYARQQPHGVSLKQMFDAGKDATPEKLLVLAKFLYKEVPIRLARRAIELQNLPYGLSAQQPVQIVRSWYEQSFRDILSDTEPMTIEDEQRFTQRLEVILDRHKNVVPMMAKGVLGMKKDMKIESIDDCPYLQDFLDRFYLARIGIRMLIHQHVELHHPKPGFVGVIDSAVDPAEIAKWAAGDASRICERAYGNAPEVVIRGTANLTFRYVPHHLHHMMVELLKNSMRAVVETHGAKNYDLPPVEVIIADGPADISIKISDQGGGIPRKDMPRIWTYLYTTVKAPPEVGEHQHYEGGAQPMAGFGYGLPVSRLYARYFGGDLEVMSMHGYGTDAYLQLNKLGDSEELLPL